VSTSNRSLEAARAKRVQHLHSGFARQPHVEDHEVVRIRARETLAFLAIRDEVDAHALLLQPAADETVPRSDHLR
jgi:hypothetical protein